MPVSIRRALSHRHRSTLVAAGFVALAACGGEPKPPTDSAAAAAAASAPAATSTPAATPATTPAAGPAAAPAPITGKTHDVRMLGDATGYRFEPATLTIKAGDGIRWIMVSGGPHNVSFWQDSVPAGAATLLTTAMTKQMSPLAGPLLMQPNESYTISFAGAPAGTYHYFCTPHLALGMKATITVK